MKRSVGIVFIFFVGAVLLAVAQRARDGVIVDPDVHKVVLENEYVRVLEAKAAPGHKSPMHSHPSLVLVSVGTSRVKLTAPDGKASILDLRPGQVFWMENPEHSWEMLSGDHHVVAVEVKSAQKAQPK